MKTKLIFASLLMAFVGIVFAQEIDPLNAVIKIETVYQEPDYIIPWQDKPQENCSGSGVVIDGNRILTNAHNIADATYITVYKQSADDKYLARVMAVDHDCDLALLEVEDKSFFSDIAPFPIGQTPPTQTTVYVAGYPVGGNGLSITQGIISRIEVQQYVHSLENLLTAQLDAAINPGNSGGPVLCEGEIIGIAFQVAPESDGIGYMIPTDIIRHFLKDIEDGHVEGFKLAGFSYLDLDNEGTRRFLKMNNRQSGVRIFQVSKVIPSDTLKVNDVLMEVDGVNVANNGNIRLASGETRSFATLLNQKQRGESVELTLLRDGKEIKRKFVIQDDNKLCKPFLYGKLPDYYIIGGFVFTTLSYSYLDEWKEPPKSLMDYMAKEKENPDDEVVVLVNVLSDNANKGYQYLRNCVLTTVNGTKIRNLRHLIQTVESCSDEFITFSINDEFPITLELKAIRTATPQILKRYRIPSDRSDSMKR